MGNPEERLDIINEQDEVVGSATRKEVYEQKLMHRIVHVLVYNTAGDVLLQLRSKIVSLPNHWTTSVGGHVGAGESYEAAARRESQEEIGVELDIALVDHAWFFNKPDFKKRLAIYRAEHNGPFVPETRSIDELRFFSKEHLDQLVHADALIHPELRFLIEAGLI